MINFSVYKLGLQTEFFSAPHELMNSLISDEEATSAAVFSVKHLMFLSALFDGVDVQTLN